MRFSGRVAVVTGGASGIGRAVSEGLAAEGAAVAVADLDQDGARAVAASLDGGSRGYRLDVSDPALASGFAQQVESDMGPVDVVVSNAGWDEVHPFLETDEAFWERVISINLKGHMAIARALLPGMVERGRGTFVTVAFDAGRVGSSGEAVYSGAKGGVIAFSKALARETARSGIRVNCIAPGLTETPLLSRLTGTDDHLMTAILKSIPMRRLGEPREIARAVLFMASDEASYITGQVLSVNGGLSMV